MESVFIYDLLPGDLRRYLLQYSGILPIISRLSKKYLEDTLPVLKILGALPPSRKEIDRALDQLMETHYHICLTSPGMPHPLVYVSRDVSKTVWYEDRREVFTFWVNPESVAISTGTGWSRADFDRVLEIVFGQWSSQPSLLILHQIYQNRKSCCRYVPNYVANRVRSIIAILRLDLHQVKLIIDNQDPGM